MGGLTSGWNGDLAALAFSWSKFHSPLVASWLLCSPILAAWQLISARLLSLWYEQTYELLEYWVPLNTFEELALPLLTLLLLRLAHSALAIFDDGLFGGGCVQIA